jgi:hypothetical protein
MVDAFGKRPKNNIGQNFENNEWMWKPLMVYCELIAPKIKIINGLNTKDSRALSKILKETVATGHAAKYELTFKSVIVRSNKRKCHICDGTGKRKPPPIIGAGIIPCNDCNGCGEIEPLSSRYDFNINNINNFAEFLENCGGFEIC